MDLIQRIRGATNAPGSAAAKTAGMLTLLFFTSATYSGMKVPESTVYVQRSGATLPGSDGQTHRVARLTQKGPVFVLFLHETCPHSWVANRYFDQLARGYAGKIDIVGLFNAGADRFRAWDKRFHPTYPVLFDAKAATIHYLGVRSAPSAALIDATGRVVKVWSGLSKAGLDEMNRTLAKTVPSAPAPLDVSGAPDTPQFGCTF